MIDFGGFEDGIYIIFLKDLIVIEN